MKPWNERPIEQRTLLNPAFIAALLTETATGHHRESNRPLPFAFAFIAVPVVMHQPTRDALPTKISTSMYVWLERNPEARSHIPEFARQFVPHTTEAIRIGVASRAMQFGRDGGLVPIGLDRAPRGSQTAEVRACRDRARFVGRWLSKAGDPATALAAWGLAT
jgi:Family of unknown function (DUF6521)